MVSGSLSVDQWTGHDGVMNALGLLLYWILHLHVHCFCKMPLYVWLKQCY